MAKESWIYAHVEVGRSLYVHVIRATVGGPDQELAWAVFEPEDERAFNEFLEEWEVEELG